MGRYPSNMTAIGGVFDQPRRDQSADADEQREHGVGDCPCRAGGRDDEEQAYDKRIFYADVARASRGQLVAVVVGDLLFPWLSAGLRAAYQHDGE